MANETQPGRIRAAAAVTLGRLSGVLSRRLRMGGGTSLPGTVARRVDPTIASRLSRQLAKGSIIVTATNGKTTTCGLIAAILRQAGLRVWRNREGANLINGVTAALIIRANLNGRLRRGENTIAIFEVDEAAFPAVVRELQPRAIVINNLFRDQLDRYGEVETVATRWRETLAEVSPETMLVLNADDPSIAALSASFRGKALFYGIDASQQAILAEGKAGEQGQTIDARTCPNCGADLEYSLRFYSHIGHYTCPNCGHKRPTPALVATEVTKEQFDRQRVTLSGAEGTGAALLALPGFYNVYNALAAATVASGLGIEWSAVLAGLERFRPAFGRGETIEAEGRTLRLMLAKNPTGFTEVLRALFAENPAKHLLLALNDNAADGRDISWVWDVDFEQLAGKDLALTISGIRADDLAVRLKYAGVSGAVEENISAALTRAIEETPPGETLYIVPTYTAMLAVRGELERRGYTAPYWEGKDA
ncbi:MAG TPA: Mur ligase family protein [Ktedonobacterales bacterium]|nr:Mur ligase family protein [Ktedonobacterales bacterium]